MAEYFTYDKLQVGDEFYYDHNRVRADAVLTNPFDKIVIEYTYLTGEKKGQSETTPPKDPRWQFLRYDGRNANEQWR